MIFQGSYINYYGNKNSTDAGTQAKIGGIAGYAWSAIENCTSYCDIFASGIAYQVGGIVGHQSFGGAVHTKNCNAYGKVTLVRAKTRYCYLACGGIVGYDSEVIENCNSYADINIYYDGTVSGSAEYNWADNNLQPHCGQIYGLSDSNVVTGCTGNSKITIHEFDDFFPRAEIAVLSAPLKNDGLYEYSAIIEGQENVNGTAIVVLYNYGKMVGVDMQNVTLQNNKAVVSGKVDVTENARTYAIFFWKSGDMRPYAAVYSGGVKNL